ncbi:MAG: DUF4361 domain-containing protein [Prevotellaceae bacterium]|jgi:hypothetical protein|nr:DUF4361 domain-containing protein [Prevotellaceae bacterium]
MKHILKYILTGAVILSLMSCERDLFNEEHYRKIIYLKSGDNNICSYPHAMNDSVTVGYITVGSAGSMPLEKDLFVTLEQDVSLLEEYNYRNFDMEAKYARLLDNNRYVIPSYTAVLKAGEPSATAFLPVEVDANRLSPDTVYMIPLRIKSAEDCEINQEKEFALYRIELENRYSSPGYRTYKMKGTRTNSSGNVSNITTNKELIPLAYNQLRLFPESVVSSTALGDINSKTIVIVVNDDNTVRIRAYKNIIVEQLEDCNYDAKLKVFVLNYRYKLSPESDWTVIRETLTRIE